MGTRGVSEIGGESNFFPEILRVGEFFSKFWRGGENLCSYFCIFPEILRGVELFLKNLERRRIVFGKL